jgi:branched-chain amino acid transport system substrate-binding protein
MKKTGGKWPGAKEFTKIFGGIKLDSIRGPVFLDDQMNPVHNIYIRKVEKKKLLGYPDDELWNTVVKTYKKVGQYWKYNKDEFLKQPVYSRTFPPCNYCK